ncbi:MAG: hypothetical protein P8I27_11185 [Pirellulaceae bacterium]|nr:hypothetical protein [Pirellulaceae bacterium]
MESYSRLLPAPTRSPVQNTRGGFTDDYQQMVDNGRSNLWKALGPGILVACAAIGGSHLVWATRAGAEYGWSLVGLILMANLFKYPFFLYGQKYTAATGESLLAGYQRQGNGYVWTFLAVNVLTGIINIAGVAMLTGALLSAYGLAPFGVTNLGVGIMVVCGSLLLFGHYRLLDALAKIIIVVLALGTLAAVFFAFLNRPVPQADFVSPTPWNWASFTFLVMLLGWMPAPIDLSAWSSLWMFSRKEQTGHMATTKETSIDFHIGYISAVVLAICFLALGALVMHGTGEVFSDSGTQFSEQLIDLYTKSIGEWSRYLILTAAFVTMFSTTLTCLDGYPRSLAACCALIGDLSPKKFDRIRMALIILSIAIAAVVDYYFANRLLALLGFAAIVSFVTSPILAFINLKVMNGSNVPESDRPGPVLMILSWLGLLFFALMTAGFVYARFLMPSG